jgi:hypothetical protein
MWIHTLDPSFRSLRDREIPAQEVVLVQEMDPPGLAMTAVTTSGATGQSESLAEAVAKKCRKLPAWPNLKAPAGYPDSLALCLLDAIWSMGVKYGGVINVLDRYKSWLTSAQRGSPDRSASQLIDDIDAVGGGDAFAELVNNRGRTSTRNGILKAQAVRDAASNLVTVGIDSTIDLRTRSGDREVERAFKATRGQSSGISWHYLLILAGVEDIKADRMIRRFVAAAAVASTVTTADAYQAVHGAYCILTADAPGLTLRALDHAIWNSQRGGRSRRSGGVIAS